MIKNLVQPIASIIKTKIKAGCVFDTHTIIEYLLQHETDLYLSNYRKPFHLYHAGIGKTISHIADTTNGLLTPLPESWSMDIHKGFSTCGCWLKNKAGKPAKGKKPDA